MEKHKERSFRLPATEVRKSFLKVVIFLVVALPISLNLQDKLNTSNICLMLAVLTPILLIFYYMCIQHTWLTLTEEGIKAGGITGREVLVKWHEPATIEAATYNGLKGATVRRSQDSGPVGARLNAVFLPSAITKSPEFVSSVKELSGNRLSFLNLLESLQK